jgi:murein DD-endopeptidase MepM/ murein hydrolase activator NlpD
VSRAAADNVERAESGFFVDDRSLSRPSSEGKRSISGAGGALGGEEECTLLPDLAAPCGSGVSAASAGEVIAAGPNNTYGNWILIDHGSDIASGYAHLADGSLLVGPGQLVRAGDLIGAVGSTGASSGCHFHFEVRIEGTAVDAVPFMQARGIRLG